LGRAEAQKKEAVKNENFVKYNFTRMLKKVIDDKNGPKPFMYRIFTL